MTKVEKVKKLMEKYGLSLSDLEDVEDEEIKPTEPKEEIEEVKTEKVEEQKEIEKPVETEIKEEPKVENETTEEVKSETNDIYKSKFEELNKEIASLKMLVEAQSAKTDKAYEMLDAQGKTPSEEEYEYTQKLGSSDIQPNFNSSEKDGNEFANALQSKKNR